MVGMRNYRALARVLAARSGPWGTNGGGCRRLSVCTSQDLRDSYHEAQSWLRCKKLPPDIDTFGVFSNDHTDLKEVEVYGFDYDYTLASYKKGVEYLIHDIACEHLVSKFGYPDDVGKLIYDPNFAIRGLHFDVTNGLFLKVDNAHLIQFGSVYRGRIKLTNEEVLSIYHRRQLSVSALEGRRLGGGKDTKIKMVQLVDIFSKPEMSLIAGVMDYFSSIGVPYETESLYYDVSKCIGAAHGTFHMETRANPHLFLHRDPKLLPLFENLKDNGKKIFLITNSPFETVDVGMSYVMGHSWRDFFDVIIVQAGKPHFFTNTAQPFRELDINRNVFLWNQVASLDKGKIYAGGTISHFQRLTGWEGGRVIYFGDHLGADLADVTQYHGWKTAAVIRELEQEIRKMNRDEFKWGVNWQQVLMALIEDHQSVEDEGAKLVIEEWKEEVRGIQNSLRTMFNPHFGSAFRSHNNPTYFFRKLARFSDIYTSRVTNLLKYGVNHSFYPRRGVLPHEFKSWFV